MSEFQNESEREVDQYFGSLGIPYHYTGNLPDSPDFELNVAGVELRCEVKEFRMNKEERRADQEYRQTRCTTIRRPQPGERLRERLDSWKTNLRKYAEGSGKPLLLLIQSQFPSVGDDAGSVIYNHLNKHNVIAALYGYHTGNNGSYVSGLLRKNRKPYISAVAVFGTAWELRRIDSQAPALVIYHNKFAERPLHGIFERLREPLILNQYHYLHYSKHPNDDGENLVWIEVSEQWNHPDLYGSQGLPISESRQPGQIK